MNVIRNAGKGHVLCAHVGLRHRSRLLYHHACPGLVNPPRAAMRYGRRRLRVVLAAWRLDAVCAGKWVAPQFLAIPRADPHHRHPAVHLQVLNKHLTTICSPGFLPAMTALMMPAFDGQNDDIRCGSLRVD